jgi:hypothetical protein
LQKCLLILAEPMQEIQDRILRFGVAFVIRREHHAVPHSAVQDVAVESAAIDSSLSGGKSRQNANRNKDAFAPAFA